MALRSERKSGRYGSEATSISRWALSIIASSVLPERARPVTNSSRISLMVVLPRLLAARGRERGAGVVRVELLPQEPGADPAGLARGGIQFAAGMVRTQHADAVIEPG